MLSFLSSSHCCSYGTHPSKLRSSFLTFFCSTPSPSSSYHKVGHNFLGTSLYCISLACLECIHRNSIRLHFCRWLRLLHPSWRLFFSFELGYSPRSLKLPQGLPFGIQSCARTICSSLWQVWKILRGGFCWFYQAKQLFFEPLTRKIWQINY